ncbi:MAG TPA: hypothetical protein VHO70_07470 [Chitinispirillaceae bacterium]|nr:hypothetical protein [Chitinispirillaceae bacterium]
MNKIFTAGKTIFLCLCVACTVSEKKGTLLPDQSKLSTAKENLGVPNPTIDNRNSENAPEWITPEQWVNHLFVLLPKAAMFQRFGYEMYRCADLSQCSEADTFYEHSNKRIRYDRFCGDTLRILAVNRDIDGEWLVTMLDSRYSQNLYTHTKKATLTEVVLLKDFEAARERWRGKTVFSSKGVISSTGSNGNLTSIKVRRFDSLKVYDVTYGLSPLPVNPIWLMVKTTNGMEGFIAVRYSWSNVMIDQVFDGLPWSDDILEFNPMMHYNWDVVIWELIENHRITIGMEKEQVLMSWGRPMQKSDTTSNGSKLQCWIYPAQKLYFNDIALITIEDIASK